MSSIHVIKQKNKMIIGDEPQLVVDLVSQENYIISHGEKIPYQRECVFSQDLLAGKRGNVFDTAVRHYYEQACSVAVNMEIAKVYRSKANVTVREMK